MRTLPLAEISSRELRPLLDEESEHWGQELLWDYTMQTFCTCNST